MKLKKNKINSNMNASRWIFFAATCGIVLALYIFFCVVPILQSVRMSFYEWTGYKIEIPKPVGLENYKEVLGSPAFWNAFKNDLVMTLIKEVLICFLTVLFAVTLTRFKMREGEVILYKFVFYLPNVLSTVVIGSLWGFVFSGTDIGLLNSFLSLFKEGAKIQWLTNYPMQTIGFVASWCGVGLFMLTMIAAIHQIPAELYEAARIDGAGEMRQLFAITMPAVWLQVTFMIVSILYQSLGGNFALVNVFLTDVDPESNGIVMGLFVYKYGTNWGRVGFSYAASIVMLAITATISLGVKYLMDKAGEKL